MNQTQQHPKTGSVSRGEVARNHTHMIVLMVVTALGIYFCYQMALPFLSPLVWAVALAVVFMPVHHWLESRLKNRTVAALMSVLIAGLIVVVPATFVGQQLVLESAKNAQLVTEKINSGDWRRAIETRPRLARIVDRIERHVDLPGTAQTLAGWLTNIAQSIVRASVIQAIALLLTFYLLFFLIRDRRAAFHALRSLSPLSAAEMDRLLTRVGDTISAMVYGTLAVAAVQGLLGGLMFWYLGLPAPLLWGVIMALLALVPVLGAFVVWIPTALFLALDGSWGKALILALWGMIVVGGIDNVLRPILVGKRLKLHTVLNFMSVLGGVLLLGTPGIILGPVLLTVTIVLLEIWCGRSATDDAEPSNIAEQAVERISRTLNEPGPVLEMTSPDIAIAGFTDVTTAGDRP